MTSLYRAAELYKLVAYLRNLTGGVPIGLKIGATHHLKRELDIITDGDIDFLIIDGKEAGIYYGPGILEDDVGLPTLPASISYPIPPRREIKNYFLRNNSGKDTKR